MKKNLVQNLINEFIKGNRKAAIKKLLNYTKKNPRDYSSTYNLGYMYHQTNQIDKAIKYYLITIKLNQIHWESRANLAIIYIQLAKYSFALKFVNQVLKIKKNYQPALRDKAFIYYNLKEYSLALEIINISIVENESDYIAINTKGLILIELKKLNKAYESLEKALKLNTNYAFSYNNLGRCLELMNEPDKALNFFFKASSLDPNSYIFFNNIAGIYVDKGLYEKGLEYYFKALNLNPENLLVISNIAKVYFYTNQRLKSHELILECLKKQKDNTDFKKTYAGFLFKDQNYTKAWHFFESRFLADNFISENKYSKNINQFIDEKKNINQKDKILVVKEQGVGDEILYSSMYRDLFDKFKNVKIECHPKLLSFFKRNFKEEKDSFMPYGSYSSNTDELKKFDKIIYAASLGKWFRNKSTDFLKQKIFISDKKRDLEIKKIMSKLKHKPIIGFSWKSFREKKLYSEGKSILLEDLIPIFSIKNCSFINLQYGNVNNEIKDFNDKYNQKIINFTNLDLYNDIESLVSVLKNIDLFITVSNTTAHIAGSLGIKTWLITPLPHASFPYWNQVSDKTPWYKSVRLYAREDKIIKTINTIKENLISDFKS